MATKKNKKQKSAASLRREIAALHSTLDKVWEVLVDIDEATTQEEAVNAVYNACEIMAADWPDDFEMTDELSPKVQEQIELEEQLSKLAEEVDRTEDLSKKVMLSRKALAIQFGIDEQYLEQQIGQIPPEEYAQLAASALFGLMVMSTINFRQETDHLITVLRGLKKAFPRKHGPAESPIVSEALSMRDNEGKPYRVIFDHLAQKYGEQMISQNLTPKTLADRVRSRRSRLRRSKKNPERGHLTITVSTR